MRNLNGLKWIYALAIVGTTANADLIIDNQAIPGADISSITISPTTGNIFVSTIPGYDVTKSTSEPPPPGEVAMTSFSASPSNITEGQNTTLSWTTANASSCTPTGGTGGWNSRTIGLPNSSTSITIASAGTYTFGLTCEGASGDPVSRSVVVTAQPESPDPVPTSCGTPALSGNITNWSTFWQEAFPAPRSDTRPAIIPIQGYYALKFNTGDFVDDGRITSIETTNTTGVRLGAFSECPGDFDVQPECFLKWGLGGGMRWATNGRLGACQLNPNTTYYFNITFTNGVTGSTTTCPNTPCVTALQHSNR
jgi:hypothetical protein